MKIAICDDNMEYINTIENYIHSLRKTSVECDAYQSGEELIRYFRDGEEQYDVIFLDMEMEKLNGIETANYIRAIDEHVIIVFVTSHTEYMRESFKCAPFRFLVKPVDGEEFETVFYDISKKLSKQRKVFAFTENKAKIRLYCDDIIYCEMLTYITVALVTQKYNSKNTKVTHSIILYITKQILNWFIKVFGKILSKTKIRYLYSKSIYNKSNIVNITRLFCYHLKIRISVISQKGDIYYEKNYKQIIMFYNVM